MYKLGMVIDFVVLSDDIYTSMKATIARCVMSSTTDGALSHMECRNLEDSLQALSFFHISSHMPHSCDPNALAIRPVAGGLRVAALKNISNGEKLTMSYLPFVEGTSTAERQLHLMRIFGLHCQCKLCVEDLPIPA